MMAAPAPASTAGGTPGPSLRDIHLPAEPSWWPPAPGWWALAIVVLALLAAAVWVWRRQRRLRGRQMEVLNELDVLTGRYRDDRSAATLFRDLHQLLRRVARQHDGHAALQRGAAWRQTLARVPVDAATLDRLLTIDQLIYQPPGDGDHEAIIAAVRTWLRAAVKPSNWKPPETMQEAIDA